MTDPSHILRIAVARPLYQLLDYLPIPNTNAKLGARVCVPLGFSQCTGIVIHIIEKTDIANLKQIIHLVDQEPLFDQTSLQLLRWASQYYHHPIGEVMIKALPVLLRGQRQVPKTFFWQVNPQHPDATSLNRAPKQKALFTLISEQTAAIDFHTLRQQFQSNINSLLTLLEKKGFIYKASNQFVFQYQAPKILPRQKLQLTDEQQTCLNAIEDNKQTTQPKPILLHGITGSGKTEVYCRAIAPLIKKNQQILIIVPEIGLTPQLQQRFEQFFPEYKVALMHSKLNDSERMNAWLGTYSGQLDILIGTRSAVFTPMPRLGMIIVDEEHDSSLKQYEKFTYHARDIAIKRAYDLKISIILGSATPSLESFHNSEIGRYHYLRLSKRPSTHQSPKVLIQDIRALDPDVGIAPQLLKGISNHLAENSQVMLFLNRRGFAPTLYCPNCGWHAQCPHCDNNMTYHASSQQLLCHRCDNFKAVNSYCPDCKHSQITTQGQGTERIEQKLQRYFPKTTIIRIDRDTTSRKGELKQKLAEVHRGDPCILIGTQMLAKGHDFPNLTLVGILDIDHSLFSTDFRAWERLSQLIIQVSGRAGRAEKKGTVILQTTEPEHPFFHLLLSSGYLAVARYSLEERKNWHFPPYSQQALIRASATQMEYALEFLDKLKVILQSYQKEEEALELLGAAPSPIEKRAKRYRAQLLMNTKTRSHRHYYINRLLGDIASISKKGQLRWSIDIDPMDYA
ncbi:MAG: primosomal protein N' [Thiotrichaceae bacterium]|nr:primosomal protein N' [Thiotrichaceae bacterium]